MHPLFHVETMKVECNPQHIPQEAVEMFGHALCIPGNFRSMRFEVMESQFDPTVYSPNPVNMMLLHKVFPFLGDIKNTTGVSKSGCFNGVEWTAVVLHGETRHCFFLEGFKPCSLFATGSFAPMFVTSQMPQDRISRLKVTHVFSGCCMFCVSVREKFMYCSACKARGRIALYCDASCQLKDWKQHKKTCCAKKV